MKTKPVIFILYIFLLGCSKDNSPNITLNGALTNCATGTMCTYNYYQSADFTGPNQIVDGNYRVFAYNNVTNTSCGSNVQFYFKTALSNNYLDITSSQIAAGQVLAYNVICACCAYPLAYSKPIGGEIKGEKTDSNHWLINASIVFGNASNVPVDTITVNQYFTLEKLP
jgi:hypothetical protein